MRGAHCLSQWSRTQASVALSSAEAELNAALKGAVELLGARELVSEMGDALELHLLGDSSACKGILSREGSGRVKHLEVRQLWSQQYVRDDQIRFAKIPRAQNGSDTQTKHWMKDAWVHFQHAGFHIFE